MHEAQQDIVFFTAQSRSADDVQECPVALTMLWEAEVEAAAYAAPLLFPLHNTGSKQVVVATYDESVEVLNEDGHKAFGWPVSFATSTFHSSPVLFDIDMDGADDVVVADARGRVVFIDMDDDGQYLRDYVLYIPRLGVPRDWHEGLTEAGLDASLLLSEFEPEASTLGRQPEHGSITEEVSAQEGKLQAATQNGLFGRAFTRGTVSDGFGTVAPAQHGVGAPDQAEKAQEEGDDELDAEPAWLEDDLGGLMLYDDDDELMVGATAAGDEETVGYLDMLRQHVLVDAHLLSAPVIMDVNGDGGDEVVLTVSYYFDEDDYDAEVYYARGTNDTAIDLSQYSATGVVCYDLHAQKWLWQVHLDLSASLASHPSVVHASPTIADVDGDGVLDIVVPTMAGYVYMLTPNGTVKQGFPVEMDGPVEAQVLVEDVAGDSALELIVADDDGNLVVWSATGKRVWQRTLHQASPDVPSIGDVDADGKLEIVYTSRGGGVWVLDAATGDDARHFPIRLEGKIMAAATLLELPWEYTSDGRVVQAGSGRNVGAHIVVPALDGYLYLISAKTGCFHRVYLGEHVYARVVADDVDQDGLLDLVVCTMSGRVVVLSTKQPYHPLNALSYNTMGATAGTFAVGHQGVFFLSNRHQQVVGARITLHFEVIDARPPKPSRSRQYTVTIRKGRQVLYNELLDGPGVYTATVTLPTPQIASLHVEMVNEHGQRFTDVTTVSFNTEFHQVLPWAVLLPILFSTVLLFCHRSTATPLPSVATSRLF